MEKMDRRVMFRVPRGVWEEYSQLIRRDGGSPAVELRKFIIKEIRRMQEVPNV